MRDLLAELEPTPGRWRRAARVGLITALGAGATAAMQIANPLGLTLLFNFALPEAAFSPACGAAFLGSAALFQTLGLVLVGALVDSPIVDLTVFILLCLVTTYLIYAVPTLGRLWVWIQVPVVSAFYLAIFTPNGLGWDSAQGFAGLVVAVAVLLLCNSIVRPEPAESVLADSIAAALERLRLRLATLIGIFLGELPSGTDRPIAPHLGYHLSLFGPVAYRAKRVALPAALLADVMAVERLRDQVERLAAAVAASDGRSVPAASALELHGLALALNRRIETHIRSVAGRSAAMAQGASGTTDDEIAAADAELAGRLERLGEHIGPLSAITAPMARICEILETDRSELPLGESEIDTGARQRPAVAGNFLLRFSTRHTIALTAAFLVGLWDDNPALHAAIWLLMIGGPPSHGATVRKFTIRAVGVLGALALAALGTLIVAPNFTSPGPYMIAIFAGTLLMAYIGEGGGILSYLSIGGTAFVIGYSGSGPRSDVLGSIWSIWGISLGMIIRAAVSLAWRERASRTLAEQFQVPLAAVLELLEDHDGGPEEERRRAVAEMTMMAGIETMLTVANDALLEGRGAGIDGDRLVDALDTLSRLAFTIGNLARQDRTRAETARSAGLSDALRIRLESWLNTLRDQTESGLVSRTPLRQMIVESIQPELYLPPDDDSTAMPAIDRSYCQAGRRLLSLTRTLENQLAAISLL